MKTSQKSVVLVIYCTAILTICSLYAAQPIQPVFQEEFSLSNLQALLFTTLMMFPLGVAPLFYGFLLETFSAKRLLRYAVLGLGVLELIFACSGSYFSLLLVRAIQGLLIPAILTSIMSYISLTSSKENVQHAIAVYIGSTIVGGFLGRMLSGIFTELFGWRVFFIVLGGMFILCFFLLKVLEHDVNLQYVKPRLNEMIELVVERKFFWLYVAIFSIFFVFSAMMNFLPFALKSIAPQAGEAGVGLLYIGYIMGVVVSLNSRRIIAYYGGEVNAIRAGVIIFICGTMIFLVQAYAVMFFAMFVFCTGLFMAHSLLSGFVNKMAVEKKSMANGLYISFYYMGGTFGSFLPGFFFERYGWTGFLLFLLFVLSISLCCIARLNHHTSVS